MLRSDINKPIHSLFSADSLFWTELHLSSMPSVLLICRAGFLLCRAVFCRVFSGLPSSFSSLSCIFLLCRVLFLLCWVVFLCSAGKCSSQNSAKLYDEHEPVIGRIRVITFSWSFVKYSKTLMYATFACYCTLPVNENIVFLVNRSCWWKRDMDENVRLWGLCRVLSIFQCIVECKLQVTQCALRNSSFKIRLKI